MKATICVAILALAGVFSFGNGAIVPPSGNVAAISEKSPERVVVVATKTDDCFQCGMIEGLGFLDVKICGQTSCCFIVHLENSNVSFRPGNLDIFDGVASLQECHDYPISEIEGGEVAVTVYHEGSDGLQLEYVEVTTSSRILNCPVNKKLDSNQYFLASCH